MYRKATQKLLNWKNNKHRKPLVIRGARQVGKTWLMKDFGRENYERVAYVNMDGNDKMKNLFSLDYDISRIVEGLELESGVRIVPEKTLIILDEIQEIPPALTALKYFYENAPEYHVVVAGSLLGVAVHNGVSFPVGKVDFLDLYPLDFTEFLIANGMEKHADVLSSKVTDLKLVESFHADFIDMLKTYYITGGMPEVVSRYVEQGSLLEVRNVQKKIMDAYEQDFSKHVPVNTTVKLREVWDSLPAQLSRENKKFLFRLVRSSARAKDYEAALLWLEDAGLISKVTRVNKPGTPLKSYEDRSIFKIFMLDVGLLGAKSELDPAVILEKTAVFEEFKGAMAEQFVFQELRSSDITPYYFANDESRGEIDFIVDIAGKVIPIEVKATINLKAKSLSEFAAKYSIKQALKLSAQKPSQRGVTINMPLYMADNLSSIINAK